MRPDRLTKSLSFLGISLFFLSCERVSSPLLDNYKGDYRFKASFEKVSDSLNIFTPYKILIDNQGTDTFASFSLQTVPGEMLDKNASKISTDKQSVMAYFKAPFSGELLIIGLQPNERQDTVKIPVSVANNFKIISPEYAQIDKEQTFFLSGFSDTSLKVTWYVDNKDSAGSKTKDTLVTSSSSLGSRKIWAKIEDTYGNFVSSDTAITKFVPKVPSVRFTQEYFNVEACELVALDITAENCDSVKWEFKSTAKTVITAGGNVETRFRGNVNTDTVIATGFVTQNIPGSSDTLVIKITQPQYSIKWLKEKNPDTVFSGKWYKWAVKALKDTLPANSSNVKYTWSLSPDSLWDSLKISQSTDTIGLFFSDSVQSLNLKVYGTVTDIFGDLNRTDTLDKKLVVRSGKPKLISSAVDTIRSAIFVKDNRKFTVQGISSCGTLDSIIAIWPGRTVEKSSAFNGKVVFSHKFESDAAGKQVLKFVGHDNTGSISDTLFDTINVRLGAPVLWGDVSGKSDTIFIVVNKGYSGSNAIYYAHVNGYDTNGTIQKYYWSNNPWPDSGNVGPFDSMKYDVGKARINTGEEYYVYGRDDDGNVNGGKFIIFADSAPPPPSVFDREFVGDSVRLLWNRVLDKKDSLGTQVKIMITYGSTGEPDQVLSPYQSASKFATSGPNSEYFSYTFKPGAQSGTSVRWRVWLKDTRGSETAGSDVATFILP